jgi:hypothetical protein
VVLAEAGARSEVASLETVFALLQDAKPKTKPIINKAEGMNPTDFIFTSLRKSILLSDCHHYDFKDASIGQC